MTIPTATKHLMLDAVTISEASLHDAYPGTIGSNEISGGGYARKAITVNAASGGIRQLNSDVTFDVPASTIRWIGYWDGATFLFCAPNGGATPKNFMSISGTDTVYCQGHGLSDGAKVTVYQGAPPSPIVEGSIYYVRDSVSDSFKLAATLGGAAIDLTSAPSFGAVVCAITEDTYGGVSTHRLLTASFVIPD